MRGVLLDREPPVLHRGDLLIPTLIGDARRVGWEWEFPDGGRIPVVAGGALGTHPYANWYLNSAAKKADWVNDAIKVALLASYTPSQAHKWLSDVNGTEVANGNGYTTGGVALASPTNVVSGSTQTLSGANVSWTSSGAGFSATFAVVYDSTPGTAGTDPLVCYVDLGGVQSVSGGAVLTIAWNASGIIACTVS